MDYKKSGLLLGGLLLFLIMVSSNVPATLYEIYAIKFKFNTFVLTGIFATYVIFLIPSLLLSGPYADNHGRKKIIYIGIFFSILGLLSFLFAVNYYYLFIARAFQGIATGLISGPATAMLMDLDNKKIRAPLIASVSTSFGTATGPFFGGIMAQYIIYPLELVYLISLILIIVISIFMLKIPETIQYKKNKTKFERPKIPKEISKVFWFSALSSFTAWSVTAFFMSLAPSYVTTIFKINNYGMAGGIVFLMLASSSLMQLLFKKYISEKSIIYGLIILIISIYGIIISVPYNSLLILTLSTILSGIGMGISFLGSMKMITINTPINYKASVFSSFYIITYIGVGIPIISIGLISVLLDLYNSIIIYGIFIFILIIIIILIKYAYKIKSNI